MNFCKKCGKIMMDEDMFCSACGSMVERETESSKLVGTPKEAKTSLVFGILGITLLSPFGIPAIVFANKSKAKTGAMCAQAKAGFACGIISLCYWGLRTLFVLGNMYGRY